MTEEITPVERSVAQVDVQERDRDTPRSVNITKSEHGGSTRAYTNALLAVATATQIFGSSPFMDFSQANDMTGLADDLNHEQSAEFFVPSFPATIDIASESEAEATNRARLELLARRYVTKQMSPEEDARLAILTQKIRRLMPRVTMEDFDKLEVIAQDSEAIRTRNEERRQRLAI